MNQEEINSIISELIKLSMVDGHVSPDEAALIKKMGNMLGLSDDQILKLFEHPAPFNPQTAAFDRIVQFHRMVLLMNVDSNVSPEELNHLKWMGIKMGLNPDAVNEILLRMSDYPDHIIPPDILISIYKKYMN